VQRNAVGGISQMGRATQGVRVMNLKKGDTVSALALVVEDSNGNGNESGQTDLAAEEAAAEEAIAEKGKVKKTKSSGARAPAAKPKKPAAKKPRRKPPPKKS
jgi:DNA gyrase subunit A